MLLSFYLTVVKSIKFTPDQYQYVPKKFKIKDINYKITKSNTFRS